MNYKTVNNRKVKESFGQKFGALVRRYRTEQGLSLAEASVLAYGDETKLTRISELENGRVNRPQSKTIATLSKALKIPQEELKRVQYGPVPDTDQGHSEYQRPPDFQLPLLLSTADVQFHADNAMVASLSSEIEKIEIDDEGRGLFDKALERGRIQSMEGIKRILLTPMARDIMVLIWRESDFVSEEAISSVSLEKEFSNQELTRNSLANLICDRSGLPSARDVSALKRTVDRIVEAMRILGLIEQHTVRANLKPIRATIMLDGILRRSLAAVAKVYQDQFSFAEPTRTDLKKVPLQ